VNDLEEVEETRRLHATIERLGEEPEEIENQSMDHRRKRKVNENEKVW
jgi:hypothetical protein